MDTMNSDIQSTTCQVERSWIENGSQNIWDSGRIYKF
jgi:hypothetical protein